MDDIRGLLNINGDYEYRCVGCLNDWREEKDIVFDFNGENYLKKSCFMGDNDKVGCVKCDFMNSEKDCIVGECEDSDCEDNCSDCKDCNCEECKEEIYEGCKCCFEENEWECKECVKKYNNILYCEGCSKDFNKISVYMYKLGDENKYCCGDCINDNMRYM